MAVRQINEYLASGEPEDLVLSDNITYTAASDPAYENMFLRVGPNGVTSLYRAPDQDIVFRDTDNTSIALTATPTAYLTVVPDVDLLISDTSYMVSGMIDNITNQVLEVTIEAWVDGVASGYPLILEVERDHLGYTFLINNILRSDILATPANKTIEIRFDGDGGLLRGDVDISIFQMTKAQAAPVAAITAQDVQDHDYKLNLTTTTNLGPKLSRAEIETVIVASGYPLPTDTVSFSISDPIRDFHVTYNVTENRYVYIVTEKAL